MSAALATEYRGAGAASDDIVARLSSLYPQLIDLSLGRISRLLADLGHPERRLPPVVHVAGTNGKGSTCALLRAIGEAADLRVHVTTSPHLVRPNERFRVAGRIVDDATLARALADVEQANAGAPITLFEVFIATAFHLFTETPADLAVVEVGLGGRYDATNVIAAPAAAVITSLSLDHRDFLGDTVEAIAGEKSGIMKRTRPAIIGTHPPGVAAVLRNAARDAGAVLWERDRDFAWAMDGDGWRYEDRDGALALPLPSLAGAHQLDNAALAIAALRASGLGLPDRAFAGIARAVWPARLQRLCGRLARQLGSHHALFLDGGHNEGAAHALADQLARWRDTPLHLVIGMKQSKDPAAFLAPLLPFAASVSAVAEPGQHLALPVDAIVEASRGIARPGPDVRGALDHIVRLGRPGRVLICGSLHLAGEVLKLDEEHT